MKFGSSFRYIQKQVHVILSGYTQIWHFYCTLSRGLLFPGQCRYGHRILNRIMSRSR